MVYSLSTKINPQQVAKYLANPPQLSVLSTKINPQQVAKYLAYPPQLRPRKLVPHEDKDPRIQLLGATRKFNPRNLERIRYVLARWEKDGRTSVISASWVIVSTCLPAADELLVQGECYWKRKSNKWKTTIIASSG